MDINSIIEASHFVKVIQPKDDRRPAYITSEYRFPTKLIEGLTIGEALEVIFVQTQGDYPGDNWIRTELQEGRIRTRSTSVGDLVQVSDPHRHDVRPAYFRCEPSGWVQVSHVVFRAAKRVDSRDAGFRLEWLAEHGLLPIVSENCAMMIAEGHPAEVATGNIVALECGPLKAFLGDDPRDLALVRTAALNLLRRVSKALVAA